MSDYQYSKQRKIAATESNQAVPQQQQVAQCKPQPLTDKRQPTSQLKHGVLEDNRQPETNSVSILDSVNIHRNSSKPQAVNAHAYAQGNDIFLGPGQDHHLPHELGHVIQKREGRVKPTTSVNGMPVNDDPALEKEADVLGGKALQMKSVKTSLPLVKHPMSAFGTLQLAKKYGDSGKLARERWKKKKAKKSLSFKAWKRGREAQHLIPAQVCQHYNIPATWANSVINGMMMPSGRKNTHHLRNKSLDKGKLIHIKGGGAHPNYNKQVFALAKARNWKVGQVTYNTFANLAKHLRLINRPKKTGASTKYVDDI